MLLPILISILLWMLLWSPIPKRLVFKQAHDGKGLRSDIIPFWTLRYKLITFLHFSGMLGILLGCVLTFIISYTLIMTVSYRQRWSTVCGKLQNIELRYQTVKLDELRTNEVL